MDIQIERMCIEHLELIQLNNFDDFWNMNNLCEDLVLPYSFYIIAKHENDIVGFAGMNIVLDEAHIANIAVRKDLRNLKIGSKLLKALINEASTKAQSITLEVNEKNLPAICLYKKYGFETLGKRKNYYNNQDDAYIMTKYLIK